MTRKLCFLFSALIIIFLVVLFVPLFIDTIPYFKSFVLSTTLFSSWNFRREQYGLLPMFFGTFSVALIALCLSLPVGLLTAVLLSEFLKGKSRATFKILVELLSGVPSVVYGLIGVLFVRQLTGDSLLTAGIVLSVMLLPTLVTLIDDSFRCIPRHFREVGFGLGLSKQQVVLHILLPQAMSGIVGAISLSFGRAIGETVAVFLVVGRADNFSIFQSLFEAGQTITSKLGGSEIAIAYGDKNHWAAMMVLALFLWSGIGLISFKNHRVMQKMRAQLD